MLFADAPTMKNEFVELRQLSHDDHDGLVDVARERFATLKPNGAPAPQRATYQGGEERLIS
ncbi:MAG: hypothetical protein Q7T17_13385, partial [Microbacterium sp.]|uniref:hypothetical protein n=1 Tax=Microbacterium sp. TaxID=51671 RepID=UPI00271A9478